MHKSAAWPLALIYIGLVVYASLYPFVDWRDQGIAPWVFLGAPLPRYWAGFDLAINVAGYAPLGGLLALGVLRSGRIRHALLLPVLVASLLALAMEMLQSYLPARIPSREDWLLNTLGSLLGAVWIILLAKLGAIDRWSRIRARWFVPQSRGGLVLLALWPMALLFPPAVPFGLGQVMERVEEAAGDMLSETPFLDWLPVRETDLQPLVPGAELLCVLLGLLIPCLLGFCVIRARIRRALLVLMVVGAGAAVSGLSAALSWGPVHAWAWLGLPVQVGMVMASLLALALTLVPWRASAALLLLSLGVYLSLLNQAPESAYFAQTLHAWEQGRFIRFHGLAQWLGWLWPYAVLVYVLSLIWQRDTKN
jgi:VanZ family protein